MAVFFDAAMPFEQLRLHFKKKLFVTLEGTGRAYFRFYDPRALRALLATDNGDLANWLGDAAIARMLFEVPSRDMLACLSRRTQTGVSFGRMNGDYDTQIIELAHNESTAP